MAPSSSEASDSYVPNRFIDYLFGGKPKPKSTPSQRQDELVKSFPAARIIRRPNPMEEADDSPHVKFPRHGCEEWIKIFYEAVRLYGKDCDINPASCNYRYLIRMSCGIEVSYPDEESE